MRLVVFFYVWVSRKKTFTCRSKIIEREQVSASSQQGTLSTLMEKVPFLVPQASLNGKKNPHSIMKEDQVSHYLKDVNKYVMMN